MRAQRNSSEPRRQRSACGIPGAYGVAIPSSDRERIRALVERDGELEVNTRLGVSRLTFARCLAGLPVQRASAECVSRRLAELE